MCMVTAPGRWLVSWTIIICLPEKNQHSENLYLFDGFIRLFIVCFTYLMLYSCIDLVQSYEQKLFKQFIMNSVTLKIFSTMLFLTCKYIAILK